MAIKAKTCSYCQGTGTITCKRCGGSGEVRGSFNTSRIFTCSECGGSGTKTCPFCNGTGYTYEHKDE